MYARGFNRVFPNTFRVVNHEDPLVHAYPCAPIAGLFGGCLPAKELLGTAVPGMLWGFHHGTEVWYSGQMTPPKPPAPANVPARYRICKTADRDDEDNTCSNSVPLITYNIMRHMKYHDVFLACYCPFSGCGVASEATEQTQFTKWTGLAEGSWPGPSASTPVRALPQSRRPNPNRVKHPSHK